MFRTPQIYRQESKVKPMEKAWKHLKVDPDSIINT